MHNLDLILTLAGGLTAALIFGYVTQRLGLSPIVGYLLAGTAVGPYTPGFVAHGEIAEQLAEVGVILHPALWKLLNPRDSDEPDVRKPERVDPRRRAVVVGYGPTGRTVARLLLENDIQPTMIDMNMETVRQLKRDGLDAVYGDAINRETLEAAGVANAGAMILTSAGMGSTPEVIRIARELNPAIRVLARASYLRDAPPLQHAGADLVFTGEGEVALALTEAILRRFGATPDQIDRERTRVHSELLGGSHDFLPWPLHPCRLCGFNSHTHITPKEAA